MPRHSRQRLGSPGLQGELAFVAASQRQKTERIFLRLTVGILSAFIRRHQYAPGSSQSRRSNPLSPRQLPLQVRGAKNALSTPLCEIPYSEFRIPHYSVPLPYQNVTARRSHLNISSKGRNISHARSAYFTAPKARFHTAIYRRISLRRSAPPHGTHLYPKPHTVCR